MVSNRPPARIAVPSFLLAIALVAASVTPTIARDAESTTARTLGGPGERSARSVRPVTPAAVTRPGAAARAIWRQVELAPAIEPVTTRVPEVRQPTVVPVARPEAVAKPTATSTGVQSAASFKGRNHVWIPALGINRSVAGFACSSKAYPGNRVYRWGCAGGNNVYLFGHAYSVFKPLHDAYVSGRLRKGMSVYYAGGDGVVHRYVVRWWRVTTPDKGAWAYAAQSRPSMTLQTCVGAKSQFRLVVRLVRV